ncbi:hypothetical protein PGT21_026034 [Puccinia graminis f. sp. tritici]|uniref:Uncharacterized protein n=2 Tax=Puccinia graminis f. sp. tritici TaxID=56615 RepID=A0A5B0ML31_PUCGR|nr:hypothetical protein PGT21_026034 [Puccinia graminis f. sp. tritici]KAA1118582.1 hypothetical protein PGTUg99_011496 [Puccinia graminis f. sp. tritici]
MSPFLKDVARDQASEVWPEVAGPFLEPELDTFELEVPTLSHAHDLDSDSEDIPSQVASVEIRGRCIPHQHGMWRSEIRKRSYSLGNIPDNIFSNSIRRARSADSIQDRVEKFSILYLSWDLKKALERRFPHLFPPDPLRWQPRFRTLAPPSVPGLCHLIGDFTAAKNRILITKTHCLYPEVSNLIPFPSCLIGFRLVVDSCHPKSRVKHLNLFLNLAEKGTWDWQATIKAIFPLDGKIHETAERTRIERRREKSMGLRLGVGEYGAASINRVQSDTQEIYTVPHVSTSGVETAWLTLTMTEDKALKSGVAPSIYFAALLELHTPTKAFEATLEVRTQSREELPFKWWASPKKWVIKYDGKTEFGHLDLST